MNSIGENTEAAIAEILLKELGCELECMPAMIAKAVYRVLGVVEDEADMEGGFFMHHAGQRRPLSAQRIEFIISAGMTKKTKGSLARNLFMKEFRDTEGLLDAYMSAKDRKEVFLGILKSKDAITYQLLFELVTQYGDCTGFDFCLTPMNDQIKNASCAEEAMHYVMEEIMRTGFPKTVIGNDMKKVSDAD